MKFIIHATPKPKGRPRVTRSGHAFTPKATSNKARERMAAGLEVPAKKPDIDNLLKAVLDALNGKAYHDDNQIVEISAKKLYSNEPRTVVFISELVKGER